jgi:L-fuconolactonase
MRIDAHQHFWIYSSTEYPWIQPDWPIRRDFLPANLAPLLAAIGFDGSIAVQARQSLEESRWLLQLADASPVIKGVVGWVDLRAPDVEEQLAPLAVHPKFVGVRHVVQDEPDDRFVLGENFRRGIAKLKGFGLTYDILIYPNQLPAAIELVREYPEQPFVLDHLAKPLISEGLLSPWREQVRELASSPNVMCKVSGLVTEARWSAWKPEDFLPFLDVALQAFGPDRLMFGSDWPVALLSADYAKVFGLVRDYIAGQDKNLVDKILGLNAARFYQL